LIVKLPPDTRSMFLVKRTPAVPRCTRLLVNALCIFHLTRSCAPLSVGTSPSVATSATQAAASSLAFMWVIFLASSAG
jgi:hypothetical protein